MLSENKCVSDASDTALSFLGSLILYAQQKGSLSVQQREFACDSSRDSGMHRLATASIGEERLTTPQRQVALEIVPHPAGQGQLAALSIDSRVCSLLFARHSASTIHEEQVPQRVNDRPINATSNSFNAPVGARLQQYFQYSLKCTIWSQSRVVWFQLTSRAFVSKGDAPRWQLTCCILGRETRCENYKAPSQNK